MNPRLVQLCSFALLAAFAAILLGGCTAQQDTDPSAKVDAPGYYNGPMEPRGGNKGGEGGAN
jgi:hypothetical protein